MCKSSNKAPKRIHYKYQPEPSKLEETNRIKSGNIKQFHIIHLRICLNYYKQKVLSLTAWHKRKINSLLVVGKFDQKRRMLESRCQLGDKQLTY